MSETFGIGGHQPYSMPLCTILTKWPAPFGPAMQIALLGGAGAQLLAARGRRNVAPAGSQRRKDRIEALDDRLLAADHHAIAALQPPHPAAGPDIDIVDPPRRQLLGAPDIVDVVGIAAVDQDVVGLESRQNDRRCVLSTTAAGTISQTARGFSSFLDQIGERGGPDGVLRGHLADRLWRHVEDHALDGLP